jgi:hypothetical protein
MKVLFSPLVRSCFQEMEEILYEKEYFGFEDSAIQYVRELIFEIRDTLPKCRKKRAPTYFNRFGKNLYYCRLRKNKATQWFVFFTTYSVNGEDVYLVQYLSNNHIVSKYL